jgi:PKD repeat protein
MKKAILLSVIAIMVMTGRISATAVSRQSAQTLAMNFFKMKSPTAVNNTAFTLNLSYTKTETDGTVDFYVFNASPMKGFVIVSGDDNALPVIAYSTESYFDANDRGATGVSDWITSSATKIHYVVTNHVQADATIQNLWSSYTQGINPQTGRAASIGPLLTTIWNQMPFYNSLCPPAAVASNSVHKSVTGCVATAMAQIMKYWNYPARGTGSNSYTPQPTGLNVNYGTLTADFTRPLYWSAMPNNVTSNTDPVDTLMYELGVAVDMSYDTSGSGAFVLTSETFGLGPCSQSVFANNFYYNPNTLQGVHLSSYTTASWIALMESEIDAGRVVQYEGSDPQAGGHTWVMDGYEPQSSGPDYLHMNWGWGGASNGWFSVTNLATPGFNPTQNDAALIGIQPLAPFSLSLTSSAPSICSASAGANLSAQGPAGATYTWTPATGLTCTTCPNPTATPSATTLYTVRVDSAGVVGTASIAVAVTQSATAGFTFTPAPSCNLPEVVSFTNTSANATSYVWDFGDGSVTSTAASPLHSYTTDGSYTVKLYATNSCGMDSLVSTQPVQVSGGAPFAPSQAICSSQSANVTAVGSDINWYSDAQGANLMQSGSNVYSTGPLYNTITYYIGTVVSPNSVSAGPANDAIGTTSAYTTSGLHGLNFNCTVAQTLNSVVVYASSAGPRLFVLEDASGAIIDSATFTLITGQQTVPLGFAIPVGTNMLLAVNGVTNLDRNTSGVAYPYTSTDGTVTITGNNANSASRYYFFYDWQLQQPVCVSPLAPVTVYVLDAGGYTFTASGTGTPTVTFTPATTGATSYIWDFGDGSSTSTATSPTHTYTSSGTYNVQLIVSNGSCADTVTQSVSTIKLGINNVDGLSGLSVSPNPAKDQLGLNVNSSRQFDGCHLSITNILGQSTYGEDVNLVSGANKFNISISNLSPGIYFLSIQNGKEVVTSKFVKASE